MAFTELEQRHVRQVMEAFLERRRPPSEIRDQLDLGYRVSGQSVEIFERRPAWRQPGKTVETPVAKTTYVRSRDAWKIYWMRQDRRWHAYDPDEWAEDLEEVLRVVERDDHGCFWG